MYFKHKKIKNASKIYLFKKNLDFVLKSKDFYIFKNKRATTYKYFQKNLYFFKNLKIYFLKEKNKNKNASKK